MYYIDGYTYSCVSLIIKTAENLIYQLLLVVLLLHKKGDFNQGSQIFWPPLISLVIKVIQTLRELL